MEELMIVLAQAVDQVTQQSMENDKALLKVIEVLVDKVIKLETQVNLLMRGKNPNV